MNKFCVLLAIGLLINGCYGSAVRPNQLKEDKDGWTAIAHRFDGHVNFFRSWEDFKNGFGDSNDEFFIGLQNLHELTSSKRYELYIYLEDFEGASRYEIYDNFQVGSEDEKFVLKSIGGHTGDADDSLFFNVGSKFSTFDSDNDSSRGNCAQLQMGSWWYSDCSYA
ncbi:hypothetical protein KR093_000507 [Drosophila rubida]|uniref:Fibrinogen C-terminal domain-containing protein n=1 Tax=Drosophila rubida TaxID=30044 RepID=A0AAD4K331_9MUSC|nr:hypothetical protein KR093_000507 [Drosophila rubida]